MEKKYKNNHHLSPNAKKTNYVLFQGRRRFENFTERNLNVTFNGMIVERCEKVKILGLTIDEQLTFKYHVDSIKNKIISFIFALRRARRFMTEVTAINLYYAHVQFRFVYMSTVWSGLTLGLMVSRKSFNFLLLKLNGH